MSEIVLRAREPEDAALLTSWFADAETMRWWDRVYPPLPAETLAARIAAAPIMTFADPSFMVCDAGTREPVGWGGLHAPSPEHRHCSLGVLVAPGLRGRGYGEAATRALCRFAFDRMNLVRVSLVVFPGNDAARRVYERVGFVEEGVQRRAFWKRGAWHDLVHMAVFRDTLR
ncbi:MAG TPA: GNAT family protein [Frankiaceae bacterium]|nr:GNAT family protein [Frankiaceae bacterium]